VSRCLQVRAVASEMVVAAAVVGRLVSIERRRQSAQVRPPKKWKRHDATQAKAFRTPSRDNRQADFRRNEAQKPVGARMLALEIKFPLRLCASAYCSRKGAKNAKNAKARKVHGEGLNRTRLMRRLSTRSTLNTPAASTIRSPGRNKRPAFASKNPAIVV